MLIKYVSRGENRGVVNVYRSHGFVNESEEVTFNANVGHDLLLCDNFSVSV